MVLAKGCKNNGRNTYILPEDTALLQNTNVMLRSVPNVSMTVVSNSYAAGST